MPGALVRRHPDLLRIDGPLHEAYFAFQLQGPWIDPELGHVVHSLKASYGDLVIADWLVRPNPRLGDATPLSALRSGSSAEDVLLAAKEMGPGKVRAGR